MKITDIIHNFIWPKPAPFHPREQNAIQKRTAEESLAELSLYGRTKLLQMDTGWWCFIEVTDATAGATLTIGSEIKHTHPSDAIAECLQRVEVSGLTKQAPPNPTRHKRLRR